MVDAVVELDDVAGLRQTTQATGADEVGQGTPEDPCVRAGDREGGADQLSLTG